MASDKFFSRRNLDFTLFEVLNVTELTQYDYFSEHDHETFKFTLDAATGIAEQIMRPNYVESDRQVPELVDGIVKVHKGAHEYLKTISESGMMSAIFPEADGGQQTPKTVMGAVEYITGAAHNSLVMYSDLTVGAASLIWTFGSEALKKTFVGKMLSAEWTGTMCLTEPQAGSGLSDILTSAAPKRDGVYSIKGTKIFITCGDHDITDNIVHLVLARIMGAPKGTKGISLFVIPKKRISSDGSLVSNDVTSVGVYHKMGQKGSPALHLDFGSNDDCEGYLVGEPNQGLGYMFLMMNGSRLNVGMNGVCVGSAAYYASLQYAHERKQGKRPGSFETVAIIEHPDVRRMLLSQKAFVEGTLCFILHCFKYLDLEKVSKTAPERERYNDLLELLTPVAKAYGSEKGFSSINEGLQVLGGYGYTEDFPLEQMVRDARIFSLYEGTTGIQAQAVLGRQIVRNGGRAVELWLDEVNADVKAARAYKELSSYATIYGKEVREWHKLTRYLVELGSKGNAEVFLADANLYLELFGILNVGWQWVRQGAVAIRALRYGELSDADKIFYESKMLTMKFFLRYELVKAKALRTRLMDGDVLTIFDSNKEMII